MKYKETGPKGAFLAWGIGFNYKYDPKDRLLSILRANEGPPLLELSLDRNTSKASLAFARDIEKATQVHALMFSNNMTIDITETLEEERLVPILETSIRMARYSFDLKNNNFKRFSALFCKDLALKRLQIRELSSQSSRSNFYLAQLRTKHDNSTSARSETLHGIMKDLSDKTVRELMTAEFSNHPGRYAQNLLTVSSNLATISRILNSKFSPYNTISRYKSMNLRPPKEKTENTK